MGKGISSLKYIKNFNIENRAHKLVADETRKVRPLIQSPRHPSTAKMLEEVEKANAQNPLVGTSLNQRTGELAKQIKIKSVGDNVNLDKKATMATATTMDLRPKKENEDWYKQDEKKSGGEVDIDYEMFGYRRAERIKPGHLSLRQFDELLNDYNEQTIKSNNKDSSSSHSSSTSSSDLIKKLAAKYGNGLNETDVYILLQNYKTFQVRKLKSSSSAAAANNSGVDASKQIVGNVFPNLKSLKSSSSST